jgi:SAM-dependent methyltransferase
MTGAARTRRRSWRRSVDLLRSFRHEQDDPDRFYELVSKDAAERLSAHVPLERALAVDVGGGAGYLTQALRTAGADCYLVDADPGELSWRGGPLPGSVLGDGRRLPLRSGSVDLVVSSNVLEHVEHPHELVDEMARVLRAGGHLWLSFTNWYGPWGGHETSPWHYLGGERARRRYVRRTGRAPKNRFGENLFVLHVGGVLAHLRAHALLEVVDARPRYMPDVARGIVRVPVVRELLTWNLEVLARRRGPPADSAGP